MMKIKETSQGVKMEFDLPQTNAVKLPMILRHRLSKRPHLSRVQLEDKLSKADAIRASHLEERRFKADRSLKIVTAQKRAAEQKHSNALQAP